MISIELPKKEVEFTLIQKILEVGFKAADPKVAVSKVIRAFENGICVQEECFSGERIHVLGIGKASYGMLEGVYSILGDRIYGGVIITPKDLGMLGKVHVLRGDHPIPKENTLNSSKKLIEYAQHNINDNDITIMLISGGGSALFEVPAPGIGLEDVAYISKKLMENGADIYELNTVRKKLSLVKGGKLPKYVRGNIISLIMSDVVKDDLSIIASGPTYPDTSTFQDAIDVLKKRNVWNVTPDNVKSWLESNIGKDEEIIKDIDFSRIKNIIVANNTLSLKAMEAQGRELGFNTMILTPYMSGEAREVAKVLAAIASSVAREDIPVKKPALLLAGGETTVTVKGNGKGGRNQELCLSFAIEIRRERGIWAACIGSDGMDGNSPAAGAIINTKTFNEALSLGLDPIRYLDNNDSYSLFFKMNGAIVTGYTGTNVNDFVVILIK